MSNTGSGERSSIIFVANGGLLSKKFQRMSRSFASNTTLLHASKRHVQGSDQPAIDPYCPNFNSMGSPQQAISILSPNRRSTDWVVSGLVGVALTGELMGGAPGGESYLHHHENIPRFKIFFACSFSLGSRPI